MATATRTTTRTVIDHTTARSVAAVIFAILIAWAAASSFGNTRTTETDIPQSYTEVHRDFLGQLGTSFELR